MDRDDRRFYAERLDALWGRYVAFVNFLITISGGTVLVLLAKLVELRLEQRALTEVPFLIWLALAFAILSAIYAIFWRALAQRYMEYEVLAPLGSIQEYAGADRFMHCVTNPRRFETGESGFLRIGYKFASWFFGAFLLISWILVGVHLSQLL